MKVPIRPAPPPPVNQNSIYASRSTPSWNNSTRDNHGKLPGTIPKKKPPPRPPPPKFTNTKGDYNQAPARPSQLITSLFQRKNNSTSKFGDNKLSRSNTELFESKTNYAVNNCLIDFNSPPSSPTFTTRSSSDALSVNSFGSDGVTPCSSSSGNTSNVESGFEDDFDFFGGLSNTRRIDSTQNKDPWNTTQEQRSKNPSPLTSQPDKKGTWVTFPSPSSSKKVTQSASAMPTIIRVKPDRPKPPNIQKTTPANVGMITNVFQSVHITSSNSVYEDDDDDEWSSSESPPMPTCPPPAPPPEVLNGFLSNGDAVSANVKSSFD